MPRRRPEAEQLAEWERRIRSDDPRERGAGFWPSLMGPPDTPLDEFGLCDLLIWQDAAYSLCALFDRDQLRLFRVIDDPGGVAWRILANPARNPGFANWADKLMEEDDVGARHYYFGRRFRTKHAPSRSVLKPFLNLAAGCGATVVELRNGPRRHFMFDVMLGASPSALRGRIIRGVLVWWPGDAPIVVQAQLPADLPFVVGKERIKNRPISRSVHYQTA